MRWNPVSGAEITFLDHLGSPAASTNWGGSLLWRESYTPYGDKRLDPAANRDKPSDPSSDWSPDNVENFPHEPSFGQTQSMTIIGEVRPGVDDATE